MNLGAYTMAMAGGGGGYTVVRQPDAGQTVAAVLRGEGPALPELVMRGPLKYADAKRNVERLNAAAEAALLREVEQQGRLDRLGSAQTSNSDRSANSSAPRR